MPFVSEKQRRACWAKYNRDKKAGRKPAWDCREWEAHTRFPSGNDLQIHVGHVLATLSTADIHLLMKYYRIENGVVSPELSILAEKIAGSSN